MSIVIVIEMARRLCPRRWTYKRPKKGDKETQTENIESNFDGATSRDHDEKTICLQEFAVDSLREACHQLGTNAPA
jgi:hypothetical protein